MQRCVGAVAAGKGKERRAGRGCATVLALCPPARGRVHGIGHTEVWPPARLRARPGAAALAPLSTLV